MSTAPVVKALISPEVKKATAEFAARTFRGLGHEFDKSMEGSVMKKLLDEYQHVTHQNITEIHNALPPDHGMSGGEIIHQARTAARGQVFGPNDVALTTLVKSVHLRGDKIHAQNLMDHVAMVLHEDSGQGAVDHLSEFKQNAKKDIESLPEYKLHKSLSRKAAKGDAVAQQRLSQIQAPTQYKVNSDYRRVSEAERFYRNFIFSRFSPLIAIPHLSGTVNTMLSANNESIIKALTDAHMSMGSTGMKQLFETSGILAESTLRGMEQIEAARNGIISKYLPGSVQDVLAKVTSTPGFNYVRDWQIAFTGAASYHDAINYAAKLQKNPSSKEALSRLEMFGLHSGDFAEIAKTGKLSQEQLERAVWHGVNKRIFLDRSMDTSYNSQSNFMWRALNMYHSYVAAQAHLLKREFKFAMDSGNPAKIAKFGLYAGIAFPVVGEGTKMLSMLARGQFGQLQEEGKNDYETLTGAKQESMAAHVRDITELYLDASAHVMGFGIAYGLIQGAQRGMLAYNLLGPMLGTGTKLAIDMVKVGDQMINKGKAGLDVDKQLTRDELPLIAPYGIGRLASNLIAPTKREEQARHPSHKHKHKSLGHLKGLKKF